MKKFTEKKVTFTIDMGLLQEIKKRAIDRNMPLKRWLMLAIGGRLLLEDKYKEIKPEDGSIQAWYRSLDELERLEKQSFYGQK